MSDVDLRELERRLTCVVWTETPFEKILKMDKDWCGSYQQVFQAGGREVARFKDVGDMIETFVRLREERDRAVSLLRAAYEAHADDNWNREHIVAAREFLESLNG